MALQHLLKLNSLILMFVLLFGTGCSFGPALTIDANESSARPVFVTVTPASPPTLSSAPTEQTGAAPITLIEQPLQPSTACADVFVAHPLSHTTTSAAEPIRMFDSNGSGLAINDLDQDGDLDLVLANLNGPNSIFWNEGGLSFQQDTSALPYNNARAVNIVDVNSDGWQDIVLTRGTTPPLYYRNNGIAGQPGFTRTPLPGVNQPAYTLAWADLDQDGDLDLVTAAYDAELAQKGGDSFMFSDGVGVYYYENQGHTFVPTRLAKESQSLTILLTDLNGDTRPDIWVGNDFDLPDYVWFRTTDGWQAAQPFAATPHSTMSFAAGDLNNNGQVELFATDMHPYATDADTLAQWQPVMDMMMQTMPHEPMPGDIQVMENVLLQTGDNGYQNGATAAGVQATGWSWSSKFGDLDSDGALDLYVVNGMAAEDLFGHLPNYELVEENQAFRNTGDGTFIAAPDWQLNATAGGRGMSMADLDSDGDLDIVVNNLLQPAQIFENQLCGGQSLAVDLIWPGSGNSRALGATLHLQTDTGTYTRQVQNASGYLSGDPTRIHFGLPAQATILGLNIVWPDGAKSQIDNPSPGALLVITRAPF